MNYLYSIGLILLGVYLFYITYKDGKKKKATLTTDYIMHLNGYIASIGMIVMGLMILFKNK